MPPRRKKSTQYAKPSFSSKEKSKPVKILLDKEVWVTTSNFGKVRAKLLDEQGNVCAILREPMIKPCLDHCHADGKVRGVIGSPINLFEGQVQKLWDKYVASGTDVPLSEALRRMADYLEKDNSANPFHEGIINDMKKALARRTKETIVRNAKENLTLELDISEDKTELIRKYMQVFVKAIEENYLYEK